MLVQSLLYNIAVNLLCVLYAWAVIYTMQASACSCIAAGFGMPIVLVSSLYGTQIWEAVLQTRADS